MLKRLKFMFTGAIVITSIISLAVWEETRL